MNSIIKTTSMVFLAVVASVSCGTSGGGSKSEPPSSANVFKPSSSFALPDFTERTLANGLTVLYISDNSLPYVSYSLLVKGGSSTDPTDGSGLTSFVADLLEQGTSKRDALQVADALASMGAQFDNSVTSDYSLFSTSGLSTDAEPLLDLFIEIMTQPSFANDEITRQSKKTVAQLRKRVDSPESFVDLAWEEAIFGAGHPYSRPVSGVIKTVSGFKKKNIIQHYLKYFRPNNSILAVVGQITPALKDKVEKTLGSTWEKRAVTLPAYSAVPKIEGRQVLLVNKPGMVQSQIRIGHGGIQRNHPDFLTLRVANTILGGAFSSRLVNRVRRDLGLTYSISSAFDARQGQGAFEIATFTKNQTLAKTVDETLSVVREFREKGVTPEEVEQAKGYLAGIFPSSIETAEKLAFNLMVLRLYGISDDYLRDYLYNLSKITAEKVNAAVKAHVDPGNVKVVVFTSASDVAGQVKSLKAAKITTRKASEYQ